ncbi:hypothetical protein TNCV_1782071 [Trichonephila clavipes]|nr:hypothetical protein TNCV_1782071 [Trichonephila clavipes]
MLFPVAFSEKLEVSDDMSTGSCDDRRPNIGIGFMVSPAVQGQVRHPSIVPEFLRSTSCGMTSARGHGAIVYCLNSGSEDRQTGRHNSKIEPAPH